MIEDDQFWPNGPAIDCLVFASEVHWEFCCEYEHVISCFCPKFRFKFSLTECQGTRPTNQWSMSNKLDGWVRSPNLYWV